MDLFDPVFLARLQFAFTISFHIVLPAFSIGLASYLAVLEGLWLITKRDIYLSVFQYWLKIFAIVFAMGVVSGIVLSYEFGLNWSVFSDKTGPVIGPLMGYEVMSAFFLEAGFLGVMLFGLKKVGPKVHFMATLMVALGTLASAFWIIAVNSWMQTPAGYAINPAGQFVPVDWWAVIFNPSFPYRLVHMVLAAYLTTALAVGAVGAWHLLKDRENLAARVMFSMAMGMAAFVGPLQILAGDMHGLNTLKHQPAKIAAMEGHFETQKGAPLILFGLPNMAKRTVEYAVQIPHLGSEVLTHQWNGEIKGLEAFPRGDWPDVPIVFWSFRVMVAIGFAIFALGFWSFVARRKKRLFTDVRLHWAALAMGPAGFIAVLAGWVTTEVGRQPYTVYGLLRTADSASPLGLAAVGASLLGFVVVYLGVFASGFFYIGRQMKKTPWRNPDPASPQNDSGVHAETEKVEGVL
ncbi:cytochrome ubiquinol oxidase subunit I [Varunaivibrio sulfuroxidans]|nr:cytochrome ubiquinol oxidase subunit I [Varunaivibrio sulfuroxidans]WES30562.1 cytochrome ubiquinol oxidase subunit I [Varunaivibrio sulfuroxidans]